MSNNALKLNTSKTEFIIFTTKQDAHKGETLKIGSDTICTSKHIKVLGVTLDQTMSMEQHISNTSRSAYMHIRKINSIRHYLTDYAVKTLVQSNVLSRLDYCNVIYTGLPQKSIRRLQLTQNAAVHLATRTSYHEHITPAFERLHWLPIKKRCEHKTLMITYKALHNDAPTYICELLNWYHPSRALRSASTTSLVPSRNRTVKY